MATVKIIESKIEQMMICPECDDLLTTSEKTLECKVCKVPMQNTGSIESINDCE